MTDDEFVFGDADDPDEDLFGTSAGDTGSTTESNPRFGRGPVDEGSPSASGRFRSAPTARTAAMAGLGVALVVVVGVVGYPVVMDALDSPTRQPSGAATTVSESPASALTTETTTGVGSSESSTESAIPGSTSHAGPTMGSTATTASPTPTETPTAIPRRSFPAGAPRDRNTTTEP